MSKYDELKKCCMAFELKSGDILLIDKEDVKEIAMKIIVEGSMKGTTVMIREKDTSIEKANILYNILKSEKGISDERRDKYLRQIGELLTGNSKQYTSLDESKEYDIEEPDAVTELKISNSKQ